MVKKNDSWNYNDRKENDSGWKRFNQENQKKQHQREESGPSIGEIRWTNMGRRSGIYGRENPHSEQQENQGRNSKGKS